MTDCIKRSMCNIDSCNNSVDRNDSFHQITAEYGKIEYITRNCSNCGSTKLHLSVLEANPGLEEKKIPLNGRGGHGLKNIRVRQQRNWY